VIRLGWRANLLGNLVKVERIETGFSRLERDVLADLAAVVRALVLWAERVGRRAEAIVLTRACGQSGERNRG
jgi:hypothetical protein